MGFRDAVHQIIDGTVNRDAGMWQRFISHARAYQQALDVSDEDVSVLEHSQPNAGIFPTAGDLAIGAFLLGQLEDETFSVLAKHVCGAHYGDDWRCCIMVICTSNESLNDSVGHGTIFINVVRDDWHAKLIKHLAEGDPWSTTAS